MSSRRHLVTFAAAMILVDCLTRVPLWINNLHLRYFMAEIVGNPFGDVLRGCLACVLNPAQIAGVGINSLRNFFQSQAALQAERFKRGCHG